MFSRAIALTFAALPLLAVATPLEARNDAPASSCSTGALQCCESTTTAGSKSAAAILGLLGVVVQDVTAIVGLSCSPITVVGVGAGSSCSADTVCCEDNSFGGLISIGCLPVSL
ncbi:fungal hydrophobin [Trametes versicolor FP-101664 SS1]|uniref:fungal hydrophobin n=1 Tax=Trametes versicolor (strain FP-101664) TaxID=717944 RepID=UPI0004621278|nr:fungal hydrophobin [Trametes versicolor FP-101664 SS1]EIW61046.1 fungal hydrophobin [Trametes versicolor FP-101664 SS1]